MVGSEDIVVRERNHVQRASRESKSREWFGGEGRGTREEGRPETRPVTRCRDVPVESENKASLTPFGLSTRLREIKVEPLLVNLEPRLRWTHNTPDWAQPHQFGVSSSPRAQFGPGVEGSDVTCARITTETLSSKPNPLPSAAQLQRVNYHSVILLMTELDEDRRRLRLRLIRKTGLS